MSILTDRAAQIARIRGQAHACAGTRPYRVTLVRSAWSGGQPGRGQQTTTRTPLGCGPACDGQVTPPKVLLEGAWARSMHGLVEQGRAVLEEIDPTLTEAQLVAYGRQGPGEESWVEIEQDDRDGPAGERPVRRYVIDGPPLRSTNPYGWVLRLRSHEAQEVFRPAQAGDGSF